MGWARGTSIAIRIATAISKTVKSKKDKQRLFTELLAALTDADWDCLEEAEGIDPVFDEIIAKWE